MFKNNFFLLIFLILLWSKTKAQNQTNISIGAEIGLPSGNFGNLTAIGLGVSAKADFAIAERFALSINGGFINFFTRNTLIVNGKDFSYLPAKAGVKYFFNESLYAEAQLGAAFSLNNDYRTAFAWSPGFGTKIKINGQPKIDLGLRYEGWTSKNSSTISLNNNTNTKAFTALRIAYIFGK